jgi:hypothetical protein
LKVFHAPELDFFIIAAGSQILAVWRECDEVTGVVATNRVETRLLRTIRDYYYY